MISRTVDYALEGNSIRHGLTLLELVVVLAILAALAGVLVPLLPNLVHRATVSTCTTNLAEISKLVQTYQSLNTSLYPDKWTTWWKRAATWRVTCSMVRWRRLPTLGSPPEPWPPTKLPR